MCPQQGDAQEEEGQELPGLCDVVRVVVMVVVVVSVIGWDWDVAWSLVAYPKDE